jgi:acyl dehydratase
MPEDAGSNRQRFKPGGSSAWSLFMGMIYFEDLNIGDNWTTTEHSVDREEMLAYSRINDPWPIHVDPDAARKSPFGGLIASGRYTISLMYRLSHEVVNQPDRTWAFLGGFDWQLKFLEPVRAGDRLHERITIIEKRPSSKPGRGIIKDHVEMINDRKKRGAVSQGHYVAGHSLSGLVRAGDEFASDRGDVTSWLLRHPDRP